MAAAIEANTQATVEATELLGRSISDVHASIEGEAIRSLYVLVDRTMNLDGQFSPGTQPSQERTRSGGEAPDFAHCDRHLWEDRAAMARIGPEGLEARARSR
jgi:hypothetical protein